MMKTSKPSIVGVSALVLFTAVLTISRRSDQPSAPAAAESRTPAAGGAGSGQLEAPWSAALAVPDQAQRTNLLSQHARRATRLELPWLLTQLEGLAESELRFELRRLLLTRWAESDGASAMAYAQSLPENERSPETIAGILKQWARADATAAVAWFGSGSGGERSEEATQALASALTRQAPARVLELLPLVKAEAPRLALGEAIVEHCRNDQPATAANFALSLTTGRAQADLLGRVLPQWSQSDLNNAVGWVRQLDPGPSQLTALIHVSYAWVRADPTAAAAYAGNLSPGNEQFLTAVANQWAQFDPEATARWAQQLPPGPARDAAISSVTSAWAQRDPRAAAGFVLGLPPGAAQQDAAISAVAAWTASDPGSAVQWVAGFPSGRLREYAIENVYYSWTPFDPAAAAASLPRLPAGPDRDRAIHAGAGSLIDAYPDLATQWAAGIQNEALRSQQTERAAFRWLQTDPQAAALWIHQSTLAAEIKRRLLAAANPRGP